VLRRIQKADGCHKLLSPWEVPFIIAKIIGPGTYKLIIEDGIQSEIHGTSASYEDSTPKKHRTDSSISRFMIKVIKIMFLTNICLTKIYKTNPGVAQPK
jgi:hypothetical protein